MSNGERYFRNSLEATTPEEEGRAAQHLGPEVTSDVMLLGNKITKKKVLRVLTQINHRQATCLHLVDFCW